MTQSTIVTLGDTAFQTASGRIVNPAALRPEDIDLDDIAEHLAKEARFNGATPGVFYSVAQHSVLVADIVAALHWDDHPLTRATAALCGLLHDAPEAYLRDLATPVKLHVGVGYSAMEDNAWLAIAQRFDLPPELPSIIKRADLIALATEKRDLMPQTATSEWVCLEGVKPWGLRSITPMLWQDAQSVFASAARHWLTLRKAEGVPL